LVDTFDIPEGIRHAAAAGGPELGAVRIDSGDLEAEGRAARALLDSLGNERTRVIVTGDLDEHTIAALADAPVDGYGVGTAVVTGSGSPTAGLIYKLVARADEPGPDVPLQPMHKQSPGKATVGGRKHAWRLLDDAGRAVGEELAFDVSPPAQAHRPLQVPVVVGGKPVWSAPVAESADHHRRVLAELPADGLGLDDGPPALEVRFREGVVR